MKTSISTMMALLCAVACFLHSCRHKAAVQVWENQGNDFNFPENLLPEPPQKTAVCFSGGGTRAMTCATGQMKGLDSLGLWGDIGYVSSISGGTWASSIFTYYNSGAANDAQLLGTPHAPGNITMDQLNAMDSSFLAAGATYSFTENILERALIDGLSDGLLQKSDRIWIDAVGHCYLKPFGLYDPEKPRYFTLDTGSRDSIIARNPKLNEEDFYLVHNAPGDIKRPYLVMNSCLLAPQEYLPINAPEPLDVFNYSPLYVGSAQRMNINYDSKIFGDQTETVGGGFTEPFAFGGEAPKDLPEPCGDGVECAELKLHHRRFQLADAVGTSSAAFAAEVASSVALQLPTEILFGFTMDRAIPEEKYWPVPLEEPSKGVKYRFADGGSLENYGLITMLQRKVTKLVVFVNTYTPIDVGFIPNEGISPCPSTIDSDFPPLFGYPNGNKTHNQVFPQEDFAAVFDSLKACKVRGETIMAKYEGRTVANDWWGIPAGQSFEILFVYNDEVSKFNDQLQDEVKEELSKCTTGVLANFPNYPTVFPNGPPKLTELTNAQVNLLYELQAWNVYSNPSAFDFLKSQD